MSNKSNISILDSLPDNRSKAAFMAGGKVTVDRVWQMENEYSRFPRKFYIAKVRGIGVCDETRTRFETPQEARAFGQELREFWRKLAQEPQS